MDFLERLADAALPACACGALRPWTRERSGLLAARCPRCGAAEQLSPAALLYAASTEGQAAERRRQRGAA